MGGHREDFKKYLKIFAVVGIRLMARTKENILKMLSKGGFFILTISKWVVVCPILFEELEYSFP